MLKGRICELHFSNAFLDLRWIDNSTTQQHELNVSPIYTNWMQLKSFFRNKKKVLHTRRLNTKYRLTIWHANWICGVRNWYNRLQIIWLASKNGKLIIWHNSHVIDECFHVCEFYVRFPGEFIKDLVHMKENRDRIENIVHIIYRYAVWRMSLLICVAMREAQERTHFQNM